MKAVSGEPEPYPVEAGVWVVVLGELCVFTLFFTTFLYYRALSPELFEESRALLRQDLGALNTIILLTSSWCVASAVKALRSAENAPTGATSPGRRTGLRRGFRGR